MEAEVGLCRKMVWVVLLEVWGQIYKIQKYIRKVVRAILIGDMEVDTKYRNA